MWSARIIAACIIQSVVVRTPLCRAVSDGSTSAPLRSSSFATWEDLREIDFFTSASVCQFGYRLTHRETLWLARNLGSTAHRYFRHRLAASLSDTKGLLNRPLRAYFRFNSFILTCFEKYLQGFASAYHFWLHEVTQVARQSRASVHFVFLRFSRC